MKNETRRKIGESVSKTVKNAGNIRKKITLTKIEKTGVTSKTVNEIIEKGSDKEVLDSLLEFLSTRVELTTGYVRDDNGILTHSAIVVRCGNLEGQSAPQVLAEPLITLRDAEQYYLGETEVSESQVN